MWVLEIDLDPLQELYMFFIMELSLAPFLY